MPTYQYHCFKCDREFDKFQSMTDKALTVCPKDLCQKTTWGKGKVKRVIGSGAGLIFKGSGFYITDYRSDHYKESAKKDTPAAASGDGAKGEKKGDGGGGSKQAASPSPPSSAPTHAAKGRKAKE